MIIRAGAVERGVPDGNLKGRVCFFFYTVTLPNCCAAVSFLYCDLPQGIIPFVQYRRLRYA